MIFFALGAIGAEAYRMYINCGADAINRAVIVGPTSLVDGFRNSVEGNAFNAAHAECMCCAGR